MLGQTTRLDEDEAVPAGGAAVATGRREERAWCVWREAQEAIWQEMSRAIGRAGRLGGAHVVCVAGRRQVVAWQVGYRSGMSEDGRRCSL